MGRSALTLLVLCALATGCSLVLDPSRHQDGPAGSQDGGDGGGHDAGTEDGGGFDDGGGPDAGGPSDGGSGPDDAGMGDAGTPGDTDAGPACPGSLTCGPGAPFGWNGPVVLVTGPGGETAPACPASAPATVFTTRSGLDAPDATCGCDCTPPPATEMSCGSSQVTHSTVNCYLAGTSLGTVPNGSACVSIAAPSDGFWSASRPAFSTTASGCTPSLSSTVPPASWEATHRACGLGTPPTCGDDQLCVPPRSDGERLCVWIDGVSACPAAFPNRLETADGVTDNRGCTECTCGALSGTCNGSISFTSSCEPLATLLATLNVGACATVNLGVSTRATGSYTPMASCPPSTPTPTGSAEPTGQRTLCCVE